MAAETSSSENSAPRWSVLLPTHNRADVLAFAIRSVLAQTEGDFELLVVGDGCEDNTAEVVENFADARLRWFDFPQAPGFGYANRNIALRQTKGELVAFMAHDDLWLPDHLQLMGAFFRNPETEIAYSRPLWVAPDGQILPAAFHLSDPVTRRAFLAREENMIPAGCFVHRRDCFQKYGYWDESLPRSGDWDMWIRIIQGGADGNADKGKRSTPAYLPDATCLHFRAIWKTEATSGFPQSKIWQEMEAAAPFIPPALRPDIPAHQTEQEAIWNLISQNPTEWTRELRRAIVQVLDARLWRTDQRLFQILSSNEWKWASRLRKVRTFLAPPDSRRQRALTKLRRVIHTRPKP